MLSTEPVTKLSMPMTLWPRARSKSARCEPRNPAAPVTTEVGCGFFIQGKPAFHLAPVPISTAGMVRIRIFRSSHSDQLSMYSRSSRTQSLKLEI